MEALTDGNGGEAALAAAVRDADHAAWRKKWRNRHLPEQEEKLTVTRDELSKAKAKLSEEESSKRADKVRKLELEIAFLEQCITDSKAKGTDMTRTEVLEQKYSEEQKSGSASSTPPGAKAKAAHHKGSSAAKEGGSKTPPASAKKSTSKGKPRASPPTPSWEDGLADRMLQADFNEWQKRWGKKGEGDRAIELEKLQRHRDALQTQHEAAEGAPAANSAEAETPREAVVKAKVEQGNEKTKKKLRMLQMQIDFLKAKKEATRKQEVEELDSLYELGIGSHRGWGSPRS